MAFSCLVGLSFQVFQSIFHFRNYVEVDGRPDLLAKIVKLLIKVINPYIISKRQILRKITEVLEMLQDSKRLEIEVAKEKTSLGGLFEDSLSLLEEIGAVDVDWGDGTVLMTDLGHEIMKLSEEESLGYGDEIEVLFVDDDHDTLELAEDVMKRQDDSINLTTKSSPEEALDILNKTRFDAIVSDYLMSGMDGIDLLREVRDNEKGIPFIILTGKGDEEIAMEALNAGADYYFKKGGSPSDQFSLLSETIKKVVSQKRVEEWSEALHSFLESDLKDKTETVKGHLENISLEHLPEKERKQVEELRRELKEEIRLIDNLLESRKDLTPYLD